MTDQSIFLTRYGLHHYVASHTAGDLTVFSIDAAQSCTMIEHARGLIREAYTAPSVIRVH